MRWLFALAAAVAASVIGSVGGGLLIYVFSRDQAWIDLGSNFFGTLAFVAVGSSITGSRRWLVVFGAISLGLAIFGFGIVSPAQRFDLPGFIAQLSGVAVAAWVVVRWRLAR